MFSVCLSVHRRGSFLDRIGVLPPLDRTGGTSWIGPGSFRYATAMGATHYLRSHTRTVLFWLRCGGVDHIEIVYDFLF